QALKYFEEDKPKEAYEEFKKLLVNYPDAKEAAEAQYYLARCLEKFDKSYDAFLEYQKLIDSYPNSQRISEVIEREYNIGEYFLNRESKEVLGLSVYDFVEHPSIQIFRGIVDKVPYSEYAPRAQYKLGMIFFQLGRYEESRVAFQKVIDNYSDSEWAAPGKYQLALATSRAFPGADYDSSYLQEATSRLDEFIKEHPEEKISGEAEEQLKILRNKEAKKVFDTGQFYENQNQYTSSIIYYKKVIRNYPDNKYYDIVVEKIEELEWLIRKNLTRNELKKQEKIMAIKAAKQEKIDRKQEKIDKKKEVKQAKIDEKQERRDNKLRKKQEHKDAKLQSKQEKIQSKKELKENKREAKRIKRDAKIAEKQVRREDKAQRKQDKINKKEEKRAKKREAKQAKIDKKNKAKAREKALKEEMKKKKKKKFWFW
ncbi:MAG: tetratricopeptide repeat protein, partial [Candidatus Omnitrophica bacterium]|nr:tetratricopeptide repeat protein [Candidatus Omnitrophota bacterium]